MKTLAGIVLWLTLAIGSLSLGACTTWKPIVLPSGVHGYAVNCSGTNLSWSHCYSETGRVCPTGYKVTQKPWKHDEHVVAGDLLQLVGDSADHRRMLIECRGTARRIPAAGA